MEPSLFRNGMDESCRFLLLQSTFVEGCITKQTKESFRLLTIKMGSKSSNSSKLYGAESYRFVFLASEILRASENWRPLLLIKFIFTKLMLYSKVKSISVSVVAAGALQPYARRASEGMPCMPLNPALSATDTVHSKSSQFSEVHFRQLSIHDSSDLEPDTEAIASYLRSRGQNKRHTVATSAKPPSATPAKSDHRYSPVRRRNSEPQNLMAIQQRSLMDRLHNRNASPIEEVRVSTETGSFSIFSIRRLHIRNCF